MKDVKRYTALYAETATDRFCHMAASPTGGFVLASDYDALRAELAALREAAGKVTCAHCWMQPDIDCPDCADLRKILGEKA